ncbi:MAG: cysteine-rich KTR domain-containing protein [Lachnospiraceae bacterium]|nr:cysteine-rich KTR domain-containing protein [Robinsoniella sp.]MDY3767699.1 cysteine-rich KTR domain-containing protein [Lachnospiraceae bacterium]
MMETEWVLCPICGNKTRLKLRQDTILRHFPLFCPKCRRESLIDAKNFQVQQVGQILCPEKIKC